MVCPICKQEKDGVGPKVVDKESIKEEKFTIPILSLKTAVMCRECLERLKRGLIIIKEKELR